jgi:DNA repair exonuclease SbcCD ATPase subunit
VADNVAIICEEIGALIEAPLNGARGVTLARVERLLTDGYAQALSLEGERWRLERRIGEVAAELNDQNKELKAEELATLGRRLSHASEDLTRLRELLGTLKERANTIRH